MGWREGTRHFMGYDFRKGPAMYSSGNEGTDYMAIREVFWITDAAGASGTWPTIWQPMKVVVDANRFPSLIGQHLGIKLANIGESFSTCGFDYVSITAAPSA